LAIDEFGVLIDSNIKTKKLHSLPKIHTLLAHVQPFVEHHSFFALVCEQGIEALHSRMNEDLEIYKTMGETKRIQKFLEIQGLRNFQIDLGKY
jgi:hypothetical protein